MTAFTREVADKIRPNLPAGYRVLGYTTTLDQVDDPTVLVWVGDGTRPETLDRTRIRLDLRVQVIVGTLDPSLVDDPLDEALCDVLDAITAAGTWLDWSRFERVVRDDSWHAYTVYVTTLPKIGE